MGASRQMGEIYGFSCAMAQMTRSHASVCLLGVKKFAINILTHEKSPKVENMAQNWTSKIFHKKRLYKIYFDAPYLHNNTRNVAR